MSANSASTASEPAVSTRAEAVPYTTTDLDALLSIGLSGAHVEEEMNEFTINFLRYMLNKEDADKEEADMIRGERDEDELSRSREISGYIKDVKVQKKKSKKRRQINENNLFSRSYKRIKKYFQNT